MKTDNNTDIILGLFIELAEVISTFELAITLHVKGMVISGKLISQKRYLELLASGAILKQFSAKLIEIESKFPEHIATEESEYVQEYIHLNNARIVTSTGNLMPADGMLWRGKIECIDGYHLGNLEGSSN